MQRNQLGFKIKRRLLPIKASLMHRPGKWIEFATIMKAVEEERIDGADASKEESGVKRALQILCADPINLVAKNKDKYKNLSWADKSDLMTVRREYSKKKASLNAKKVRLDSIANSLGRLIVRIIRKRPDGLTIDKYPPPEVAEFASIHQSWCLCGAVGMKKCFASERQLHQYQM